MDHGLLDQSWSGLLDTERSHVGGLGVTLQGLARLAVNSHNYTVRVTGQINSDLDLDFAQLFLNLLFLFGLAPLDVWAQLARDIRNLVEE